jgi:hypothetical protein
MLGRAGGSALATVGHVERAYGTSFLLPRASGDQPHHPSLSAFESTLTSLLTGRRLGHAMEYFGARYAEMAASLTEHLHHVHTYGERADEKELAALWIGATDARNYVVIGDPAVRLAAETRAAPVSRPPEVHAAAAPISTTPAQAPAAAPAQAPAAAPAEAPVDADALARELAMHLLQVLRQSTTMEITTRLGPEPDAPMARTRFTIEGMAEAHLPVRDGQLDERLWTIHMDLLHEAHASRRELWRLLRALLASRQS